MDLNFLIQLLFLFRQICIKQFILILTHSSLLPTTSLTLLHIAAFYDSTECLSYLLTLNQFSINQISADGYYPLHYSVVGLSIECTTLLLIDGADPNLSPPNDYKTPIFLATSVGCSVILSMLFDYGAKYILTPLHNPLAVSLRFKHIDCFNILISKDVIPTAPSDKKEFSPLMWAISTKYFEAVPILLSHGANPSFITLNHYSPLFLACQVRSLQTVQQLCSYGVSMAVEGPGGSHPIHWAAGSCFPDIVNTVIDHGAEITAINSQGDNALFEVLRFPIHSKNEKDLRKIDVMNIINTLKILLNFGLNINSKRKDGSTLVLNYVTMKDKLDLQVLDFLIQSGFDWNLRIGNSSQGKKLIALCSKEMKDYFHLKYDSFLS